MTIQIIWCLPLIRRWCRYIFRDLCTGTGRTHANRNGFLPYSELAMVLWWIGDELKTRVNYILLFFTIKSEWRGCSWKNTVPFLAFRETNIAMCKLHYVARMPELGVLFSLIPAIMAMSDLQPKNTQCNWSLCPVLTSQLTICWRNVVARYLTTLSGVGDLSLAEVFEARAGRCRKRRA